MLGLVDYMIARQAASDRRTLGQQRPWSTDPVIAEKFLCSVVRDDDRTSREARAIISALPADDREPAALVFRYINHAPTLKELVERDALGDPLPVLRDRSERGEKVLGAQAYKINAPGSKVWDLAGISKVMSRLYKRRDIHEPRARRTVYNLVNLQVSYFIAYQIAQDLRWVHGPYEDEGNWALVGPGAIRGLARLTGRYGGPRSWEDRRHDNRYSVEMPPGSREVMVGVLAEVSPKIGCHVNLFEVEHNLCEWDKYCRISTGESKGRPFRPRGD